MSDKIIKKCALPIELQSDDSSDYHTVKGWATTYGNTDSVGDVIAKGAFSDSFKNKENREPVILWQHDHTQPIGKGVLQDTEKGVMLTARLPKNDDFVKNRVMPQLSIGALKAFSVGMVIDRNTLEFKSNETIINRAEIYETSIVTFPANPQAEIMSVKSLYCGEIYPGDPCYAELYGAEKATSAAKSLPLADMDTDWDSDAATKRIREFTKSEDAPSAGYKRAFLYYDAQNADDFTAYKMPVADVIDGELKAAPRALSAAVGAINGARGGLDVPDSELPAIKAAIASYYKKMGKENPFAQKQLIIDDVKQFTSRRDIENCLRESGAFSKKAATYMASKFDLKQWDTVNSGDDLHKQLDQEIKRWLK